MMTLPRRACLLLPFLLSLPALAIPGNPTLPPPAGANVDAIVSTMTTPPALDVSMGERHVELEHTTLADVTHQAGIGTIHHRGDAADSQYWLCYTTTLHGRPARIWLSSGELGGEQHTVGSVAASVVDSVADSDDCPALPSHAGIVRMAGDASLGSTSAQLGERLGKPSMTVDDWWIYSYSGTVKPGLERISTLEVRIRGGVVVALVMSQATTE